MATVYLALDETRGTSVALKVLSPLLAENRSFLLRFQREARIVMRLRHPNIVPLEDSGESGGYAYLAMPYIEGGTLADRLRESPLSPTEAQRLIRQIASALQHAHDLAIVHRDVKPSNILRDPQGNALLSDFGLAQIQDASVSLTGSAMLGTPSYVSPEQVRGDPVDGRTDQYALGILLFQITTGRLPFEAETPLAILAKHANEPLPLPRSVSPGIPLGVEQVILKATAKKPDDRFPSISEMDRTFQQAMAHALDPARNRAPTIKLPSLSPSANAAQAASLSPRRSRRRLLLSGLVGGAFLVIVAAMALQGVLTGLDGTDGSAGAQLTATAPSGAAFSRWGGACSGTTPSCAVTLDAARSVTATFSKEFTDTAVTATSTLVKAVHIADLRSAIGALRSHLGLSAFSWSDSTLVAGTTTVRAVHVVELRTALGQAYAAAGTASPTYTDATLETGQTAVKRAHLIELRNAVRALE